MSDVITIPTYRVPVGVVVKPAFKNWLEHNGAIVVWKAARITDEMTRELLGWVLSSDNRRGVTVVSTPITGDEACEMSIALAVSA